MARDGAGSLGQVTSTEFTTPVPTPKVVSVKLADDHVPAGGVDDTTYGVGEVMFSANVAVTENPTLLLNVDGAAGGGAAGEAAAVEYSGGGAGDGGDAKVVVFELQVSPGQETTSLQYMDTDSLKLGDDGGGTIQSVEEDTEDNRTVAADVTLPGLASTESLGEATDIKVAGVAPVVSGMEATAAKAAVEGAGTAGDTAATATRYPSTVSAQSSEDGSLVGVVVKKGTEKEPTSEDGSWCGQGGSLNSCL